MAKILLLILFCGLMIASCTGVRAPASTDTPVPTVTSTVAALLPKLVKEIKLETQTGTSYTLDWSHDGGTLAAGSGYEITLLDKDLAAAPTIIKPETGALAVTWSPTGNQLATVFGYRNTEIIIWDLDRNTGELSQVRQLDGGTDQYGVAWSPDGKLLATLGDDDKTTIQIWDTGTWKEIHRYELPYAYPRRALNWSADGTTLYDAGEVDGQAVVIALDVNDGSIQELGKFPPDELHVLAISPDGKSLAIADERGIMRLVDITSGKKLAEFKTVDQPVDLVWSPDGERLVILDYQTTLQLWEILR